MPITPSFTLVYDLDYDSGTFGKFVFTDTTSLQGGVGVGYFEITYPSGVVRQGSFASPDIDTSSSLVFDSLDIPKDANGNFLEGTYTFTYNLQVTGGTSPGTYAATSSFLFCPSIKFPSDDYAVGDISFIADCFCTKITTTDDTDYGNPTTITRSLTLFPPPSLGLASATTNSSSLVYVFSYTGGYEVELESLVTYVSGVFTVKGRVKSSIYKLVNCDIDLCSLLNCYKKFVTKILAKADKNGGITSIPKEDYDSFLLAREYAQLYDNALKCGKYNDAQVYYDKLEDIIDCDCQCDSDDDTPRLVNPYCGNSPSSGTTTIVDAGSNIDVTSTTVGSTTTYTVSLAAAFASAFSALQSQVSTNTTNIQNNTNAIAAIEQARYTLLNNDVATDSTTNTVLTPLKDYLLPANTLDVDGDYIKITALLSTGASSTSYSVVVNLVLDGTPIVVAAYTAAQSLATTIEFYMTRTASNSLSRYGVFKNTSGNVQTYNPSSLSKDLTTPLLIEVQANLASVATGTQQVNCQLLRVEHFKQA